jgi:hypothetical protein
MIRDNRALKGASDQSPHTWKVTFEKREDPSKRGKDGKRGRHWHERRQNEDGSWEEEGPWSGEELAAEVAEVLAEPALMTNIAANTGASSPLQRPPPPRAHA